MQSVGTGGSPTRNEREIDAMPVFRVGDTRIINGISSTIFVKDTGAAPVVPFCCCVTAYKVAMI